MGRKKRNLFRELLAGVRAMRDYADGKIELRTSHVSPSVTGPEGIVSGRTSSRLQPSRKRRSQT